MARVNVEETTFGEGRLVKFSMQAKCSIQEALGFLLLLWHDSQELLKASGTKEEIIEWCRVYDETRAEQIFHALLRAPYLTDLGDGLFEIHGNESQISSRITHMEKSKKGAQSTKDKWNRNQKKGHRPATGLPQAHPTPDPTPGLQPCPNQAQFNAIQGNAIQCNSGQSNAFAEAADFGPVALAELWNSKIPTEMSSIDLPRFKSGSPRWKSASERLKENPHQDYWATVIERIAASDFCRGVNDRGWIADFEFLIKPETHIKVLEKKYDRKLKPTANSPPKTREQAVMDHNRDQYERVLKGEL